jgi:HAE1 family hydrophobic/amphiphilic exporter-1
MKRVFISTSFAVFLAASAVSAQTTPQATPPVVTPPNPAQQQQQTEVQQQNQQPQQQTNPTNQQTTNPAQQPQQTLPQNPATTPPGVTPSGQIANPNTVIQQTPTQNVGTTNTVAPTDLPDDPPPVAPNFEAQNRPLPSAERVGVDLANQLPMTLEEAIQMALQNNNDIDTSKIEVQIAEFNLRGARGIYDPQLASESYYESATTPVASTIGGSTNGSLTQRRIFGSAGVSGFTPWQGGSYAVDFNSARTTSSNTNATLNPQYPSALTISYRQPIFRGRRFDNNRRQIEIAKRNLSLTDAQFRQRAIEVIAQVEQAYWDLVFALRNLQVQIDAVKQARTQLESNQRLVQKGVLAPIDVIAATTQITTFEQSVYTVQEDVTRAENNLKSLMLPDRTSSIWSRPITPISEVSLEPPRIGLDFALNDALRNRPEIAQLETTAQINQIDQRYYRDQTKPQVDLVGSYTSQGLAGSQANPDRVPPANLVGGYLNSLGNLLGQDYPTYRVGVSIALPWGNRTAKANYGRSLAEGNQIVNAREKTEQLIEAEVRNSLQALRSAEARLASALAARTSAEQLYESEQRQFRAGITTFYLVLQRQTELLTARGRELQAQTDLNKAISEFQRATGTTLSANNVSVTDGNNLRINPTRRQTTFSSKVFTQTEQK